MPKFLVRFASCLKANAFGLRLTLLSGALVYALYIGAWHLWRGQISNIPGFLFILCSFPWSLPWFLLEVRFLHEIAWPIRNLITSLMIAIGFGINCATIRGVIGFAYQLWRSKAGGQHPSRLGV